MARSVWTSGSEAGPSRSALRLEDGSRVAVLGGGPAGSLFASFVLDFASMNGLDLQVDIFEPRDYTVAGPKACNMCGGIVSETLVQNLAVDGIPLPETVVQRGIDSYVLHMDRQEVRIATPFEEKRIGAVHRGAGPRDLDHPIWQSFDGYLQERAVAKGAHVIRQRVTGLGKSPDGLCLETKLGKSDPYALLVVAAGVNTTAEKLFEPLDIGYHPPRSVKTFIREYRLGMDAIERHLGSSMHVFLLDLPGLDFAAMIPKGEYVTLCLLGEKIDKELLTAFLSSPEVQSCMPGDWDSEVYSCQCSPSMVVDGARLGHADRVLFIGDCGVSRLYKDGIGAAYRTAKAAARTVVFHGVGAEDIRRHFHPICRTMERDNRMGKFMFGVTHLIQRSSLARATVLRTVVKEQAGSNGSRRLSTVLWDMFTGSAGYEEIFKRALHPGLLTQLASSALQSIPGRRRVSPEPTEGSRIDSER